MHIMQMMHIMHVGRVPGTFLPQQRSSSLAPLFLLLSRSCPVTHLRDVLF